MLITAPGFNTANTIEEDQHPNKDSDNRKKQYIFIFMCFIQWLIMLVGYSRSTILPSLDFFGWDWVQLFILNSLFRTHDFLTIFSLFPYPDETSTNQKKSQKKT